jgi:hypothetical protein
MLGCTNSVLNSEERCYTPMLDLVFSVPGLVYYMIVDMTYSALCYGCSCLLADTVICGVTY